MWRYWLVQAARLALGLLGAALLAALVSSFSSPGPGAGGETMAAHILRFARLDFGTSTVSGLPAWSELGRRLPATLELVGFGFLIALIVGTPIGVLFSAGRILRAGAPLIQIVAAAPVFCAGLGLLWISGHLFGWTSAPHPSSLVGAIASANAGKIATAARAIALPALTVGAAGAASIQLVLRRAIGEAVGAPYRRGLRAMGLGRFEIDRVYLVPQVAAGLLAGLGEIASSLLAAAAVAEWVFDWPGAAGLFLKSVALRDWTVVGVVLLAFAALTMLAEFFGAMGARLFAETRDAL
jgi:peptide/nickel transport system permease protein